MTESPALRSAHHKAIRRLLPILILLLFVNYLDRVNVGFAAPTMNPDLGMSAYAYGLGVALFFIGYVILEVPSNYVMYRVGARRWLARIALTWGLVAALHGFVTGPVSFASVRVLLGIAEAGLLPGILWYISVWFSGPTRIRVLGIYYVAVPLSTALGGPLSNWLIRHGNETFGIDGWRFMFVVEGLAAMTLGVVVLFLLADRPEHAKWLSVDEQNALTDAAGAGRGSDGGSASFLASLRNRTTLGLAAVFVLLTFPMFAISFFVPLVASAMRDAGSSAVDIVTFVPFLLGAIASFGWSRLAQRRGLRPWRFATPAAIGGLGVATCAVAGGSFPVLVIGVALAAVGIYAAIPIFWSIASASLSGIAAVGGLALINTVGSLGGFAAGYVTGWLRDLSGGYTAPFVIMAISLTLSAAIALTRPGARRPLAVAADEPHHRR